MNNKNVEHIHNGIRLEMGEIIEFAGKWMELEYVVSGTTQAQKENHIPSYFSSTDLRCVF